VIAHKGELLWGAWSWKKFPCSEKLALALLTLCASEEIQEFFNSELPSKEVDHQLWSCNDSLVALHRGMTRSGQGISLEFYNPDNISQELTLPASLARDFLRNIKRMSPEKILENLNRNKVSA